MIPWTPLIYLANPYSHKNKFIQDMRFLITSYIGSKLIEKGFHIFSPIVESHNYAEVNPHLQTDWSYWKAHDLLMIDKCDELWVITMEGWDTSTGVIAEIDYAKQNDKKVVYIDPTRYVDFYDFIEE